MSAPAPPQHPSDPGRRLRRPRLRRGTRQRRLKRWELVSPTGADVVSLRQLKPRERFRVTLPSMFTAANLGCGFASVLLAFRDHHMLAAAMVAFSIIFDILDGAVARLVGATSPFGMQLDSMADLISFGVAPAVLIHTWALKQWPVLAWLFAFFWLGCAAFRLARFNVTIDPLADKRYFIGLPSPGAAGVPIATIFALGTLPRGYMPLDWWFLLPIMVSVVPALLMISNVRFRSFRNVISLHSPKPALFVLVVALAIGLVISPGYTGLTIAYAYVLTAPAGWLTTPIRRRVFGPDSVAPPRHVLQSVFLLPATGTTPPPADPE